MAVITVSRQLGSRGTGLAHSLAEELGYDVVDKESLEHALVDMGIPEVKVEQYDEKKPGFWQLFSAEKDRYLHFMKTAVYEAARARDCVVIGRGSQALFQGLPGILRARIIASAESRRRRIAELFGLDEQRAEQTMRRSDQDRSGYHRFFFNIHWDTPDLYDLVVNTDVLAEGDVIKLLAQAMQGECVVRAKEELGERLQDLCIVQAVRTAILYEEHIPTLFLEVASERGAVTLSGAVQVASSIERCAEVAAGVDGVASIDNRIDVVNYYLGV